MYPSRFGTLRMLRSNRYDSGFRFVPYSLCEPLLCGCFSVYLHASTQFSQRLDGWIPIVSLFYRPEGTAGRNAITFNDLSEAHKHFINSFVDGMYGKEGGLCAAEKMTYRVIPFFGRRRSVAEHYYGCVFRVRTVNINDHPRMALISGSFAKTPGRVLLAFEPPTKPIGGVPSIPILCAHHPRPAAAVENGRFPRHAIRPQFGGVAFGRYPIFLLLLSGASLPFV